MLTSTSATLPKLGEKQLDNEPGSTDRARKYPDQRNNSTPQLDSDPESADKAKKYPDKRNNSTPQLFFADSKTSREVQKRMPSRAVSPGDCFFCCLYSR